MRDANALIEEYEVDDKLKGYFRQAVHSINDALGGATKFILPQLAEKQGIPTIDMVDLMRGADKITLSQKDLDSISDMTLSFLSVEVDNCFDSADIAKSAVDAFNSIGSDNQKAIILERLRLMTKGICTFPELDAQ